MKQSIQFWTVSGITLCCLASTSPTQAQLQPIKPPNFGITNPSKTSMNLWEVGDIKKLLMPGCSAYTEQGASKFFMTGRGGLPPTPRETVNSSDEVLVDLGKPTLASSPPLSLRNSLRESDRTQKHSSRAVFSQKNLLSSMPANIMEAQGWMINSHGEISLTAQARTITPKSPSFASASCNAPKTSL